MIFTRQHIKLLGSGTEVLNDYHFYGFIYIPKKIRSNLHKQDYIEEM